jgi:hypothetical protein
VAKTEDGVCSASFYITIELIPFRIEVNNSCLPRL